MELFLVDDCEDVPLGAVLGLVKVELRPLPADWAEQGGVELEGGADEDEEGSHFFYQKWLARYTSERERDVTEVVPIPFQV